MKCFGKSLTLQELMVGLCIWRVARRDETIFTGQHVVDELDIPYSTATRLLRNWAERGVIETTPIGPDDGRQSQYRLTNKGVRMRDILGQWDQPEERGR